MGQTASRLQVMSTPRPAAVPSPTLGADGRVLEGIVTTVDADGLPHLAPMGPIVDERLERLWFRLYQTSHTYQNIKRTGAGVFHVTDDVELFARTAVDRLETFPAMSPASAGEGWILDGACRWYAFQLESLDESTERAAGVARVVGSGSIREFLGFSRAKHAVVEAAILATRVHLLPAQDIGAEFARLAPLVRKTGAASEVRAFAFLENYVLEAIEDSHR
jgi:hypothetical protein